MMPPGPHELASATGFAFNAARQRSALGSAPRSLFRRDRLHDRRAAAGLRHRDVRLLGCCVDQGDDLRSVIAGCDVVIEFSFHSVCFPDTRFFFFS